MMDSLNKVGDAIMDEQSNFRNNYIKEHADSFLAHYILDEVKQDYSLDELKELEANFTTTSVYLDDLNSYIAKQENLEVGHPCIDFTLQTVDGENVTLSEKVAQNKVTMIDFWASWCGPCRHENPVVKAAYEKYHEMGFDVIGISVDQDEAAWLKAVEADALPSTIALSSVHFTSKMTCCGLSRPTTSSPSNFLCATAAMQASNFVVGSSLTTLMPYSCSTMAGLAHGS